MSETPQKPTPAFDAASQARIIHNVSLAALIVCPIVILLPPRKFDAYTVALLSGTFLGGNQVLYENTGRSIITRWQDRMQKISSSMSGSDLPPKALEIQARLREEKNTRHEQLKKLEKSSADGVLAEVQRLKEEQEETARNLLEKVWMGNEGKDWKEKRDQKEKEALEEGRGYGGLIKDQIWEVWNWGRDKNEEVKEIDEAVLAERKRKAEEKR